MQPNEEQAVEGDLAESRRAASPGPGNESEDNEFLRELAGLVFTYPAKSVTLLVAAVALLVGGGWSAAMLVRPPLKPERDAAKAALFAHGLQIPNTDDVVVLIQTLSNNLGPKIPVAETLDPATNITGRWQYKCIALDRKYSHGGDAIIDTVVTPYGPQWRLTGTRRWREVDGKKEENLDYTWSTDWAAFTESDRIKYTYHITTDKGAIIGFADGAITDRQNGRPVRIAGTFYQLPPLDPMYGEYEFTRD